ASCVFRTSDENYQVVVSWVEIDSANKKYFYFARWDHHDKAFSSPKPIPMAENASIHEEGMPKIAFKSDGTMIALYETNIPIENCRFGLSDIQYVVSSDRGVTWTAPQSVRSQDAQKVSASFANILRLDDGEAGVSWLDSDPANGHGGRPVMFARTDGTASFSEAVTIE